MVFFFSVVEINPVLAVLTPVVYVVCSAPTKKFRKRHLRQLHGFPVCLQRLLHNGAELDNAFRGQAASEQTLHVVGSKPALSSPKEAL